MFYKLSSELIYEITKWLTLYDRLNLIQTSRFLYAIISQDRLYENLSICSEKHAEQLVTRFACNPDYGSQVKFLLLGLGVLSDQLYRQLPIIFPKVKQFIDLSKINDRKCIDPSRYLFKWADTIQIYDFTYDNFRMAHCLESSTFTNLKQLHLTQYDSSNGFPQRVNVSLMECIKHAPCLVALALDECSIDLKFMETIHASCPYLKYLSFQKVYLRITDRELPPSIVPADQFLKLKINFESVICDRHCILLEYIRKKYTSLQHLEWGDDGLDGIFRLEHNSTRTAYFNNQLGFFSQMPKSLTTLRLHSAISERSSRLFLYEQHSDLQNQPFSRIEETIESIKHQYSLKYLHLTISSSLQRYTLNCFSQHVRTLKVSLKSCLTIKTVHMGWLLSKFPRLQVLVIESSDVILIGDTFFYTFNGESSTKTSKNGNEMQIYPELEKISISKSATEAGLLDYIRSISPSLSNISWIAFNKEYTKHVIYEKSKPVEVLLEPVDQNWRCDLDFIRYHFNDITITTCLDDEEGEHDVLFQIYRDIYHSQFMFTFQKNKLVKWRKATRNDWLHPKYITIRCYKYDRIMLNGSHLSFI